MHQMAVELVGASEQAAVHGPGEPTGAAEGVGAALSEAVRSQQGAGQGGGGEAGAAERVWPPRASPEAELLRRQLDEERGRHRAEMLEARRCVHAAQPSPAQLARCRSRADASPFPVSVCPPAPPPRPPGHGLHACRREDALQVRVLELSGALERILGGGAGQPAAGELGELSAQWVKAPAAAVEGSGGGVGAAAGTGDGGGAFEVSALADNPLGDTSVLSSASFRSSDFEAVAGGGGGAAGGEEEDVASRVRLVITSHISPPEPAPVDIIVKAACVRWPPRWSCRRPYRWRARWRHAPSRPSPPRGSKNRRSAVARRSWWRHPSRRRPSRPCTDSRHGRCKTHPCTGRWRTTAPLRPIKPRWRWRSREGGWELGRERAMIRSSRLPPRPPPRLRPRCTRATTWRAEGRAAAAPGRGGAARRCRRRRRGGRCLPRHTRCPRWRRRCTAESDRAVELSSCRGGGGG
jgi:hypothetical protein